MEEIKAYKCDFCRKYSRSKSYIKKHEKESQLDLPQKK